MDRARVRVALVDVRLAEKTGEARQAGALDEIVGDGACATVQTQTAIGRRLTQIDGTLARFALVIECALAFVSAVEIDAFAVVLTRPREARRLEDFAMSTRVIRRAVAPILGTVVPFADTLVQARVRLARINQRLTVGTFVSRLTLAGELVQLGQARAVVVARSARAVIDLHETISTGETRWAVAAVVRCVEPMASATVSTRTRRFRLQRSSDRLGEIISAGEDI